MSSEKALGYLIDPLVCPLLSVLLVQNCYSPSRRPSSSPTSASVASQGNGVRNVMQYLSVRLVNSESFIFDLNSFFLTDKNEFVFKYEALLLTEGTLYFPLRIQSIVNIDIYHIVQTWLYVFIKKLCVCCLSNVFIFECYVCYDLKKTILSLSLSLLFSSSHFSFILIHATAVLKILSSPWSHLLLYLLLYLFLYLSHYLYHCFVSSHSPSCLCRVWRQ